VSRSWAQNIGLLLVSTVLALGAAEILLRRYLPMDGFLYRLHPRSLYALAPQARALFVHTPQNGGGLVLVTVNSDGFRGKELRRGGDPRILVYGDSCVEADYARLAETFTERLEERLGRAAGRRVEAVNAGTNGYGPDQALRRFQDETKRLHPSGVVFAVFADNDFGDLVRNRLYRLEEGRLVEAGGVLVDPVRSQFDPAGRVQDFELRKRVRWLIRRSRRAHRLTPEARAEQRRAAMADYLRSSVELCRREYEEVVAKRNPEISDLVKDHYDADVSFHPGSAAAVYKRALMEAVLRELRATALREGVPVLVLVVPSPIDICEACEIPVDTKAYPAYDRRRLSSEAAAAAHRAGLGVLDLFDAFRREGPDALYYRHGEDHWNAAGQDLAARLVAERIVAEGWLSSPASPAPGRAADR
jgi:SGNH hydrolase-like domain, acetyltransferase AlgX